jgi:hypothetical protein
MTADSPASGLPQEAVDAAALLAAETMRANEWRDAAGVWREIALAAEDALAAERAKVAGLRETVDKLREKYAAAPTERNMRSLGLAARVDVPRLLDALDEAEQRAQKVRDVCARYGVGESAVAVMARYALRALDGETPARIAGICSQCGAAGCQCGEGTT